MGELHCVLSWFLFPFMRLFYFFFSIYVIFFLLFVMWIFFLHPSISWYLFHETKTSPNQQGLSSFVWCFKGDEIVSNMRWNTLSLECHYVQKSISLSIYPFVCSWRYSLFYSQRAFNTKIKDKLRTLLFGHITDYWIFLTDDFYGNDY